MFMKSALQDFNTRIMKATMSNNTFSLGYTYIFLRRQWCLILELDERSFMKRTPSLGCIII